MFNERKAAQMAAWFLKQQGGKMPHLKLMKLMYLADRDSLIKLGYPITGDKFVAMPHGPVLSSTLDLINDAAPSVDGGWTSWVSDKENFEVALARPVSDREDLDELSDTDIELMAEVWKACGHMTKYQIRDFTHSTKNCPEWKDPHGSSSWITYRSVLMHHGYDESSANEVARVITDFDQVRKALLA